MRNALVKKMLIVCFLLWSTISNGQYLDVPMRGQQNSSWCWAASVEMILKFHQFNQNTIQCDIAKKYLAARASSASVAGSPSTVACCCVTCTITNPTNPVECTNCPSISSSCCNNLLPTNDRYSQHPALPSYFDILFSNYEYNSIQSTATMNWADVTREIDQCRPFIMLLSRTRAVSTGHYVVAKGYYERNGVQYVYVNDPWNQCVGCEYLIPMASFTANPIEINSTLAVVYSIRPKIDVACNSCDRMKTINTNYNVLPANSLLSLLQLNATDNAGVLNILGNTALTQTQFETYGTSGNYSATSVQYHGVVNPTFPTTTAGLPTGGTVDLLAQTSSPKFVITLQKVGTQWLVKGMTRISCTNILEKFLRVKNPPPGIAGFPGELSNIYPRNEYALYSFYPLPYEFYRFQYKDITYMMPVKDYPELKFYEGTPYNEKIVIEKLQAPFNTAIKMDGITQTEQLQELIVVTSKKECWLKRIFRKKNNAVKN